MKEFKYPIAVMCFNRPDYLAMTLESLRGQSMKIQEEQLTFWLDGFVGSKDQESSVSDRTKEVLDLVTHSFPRSKIFASSSNLGVGLNFKRAEDFNFKGTDNFVLFLEEDGVLHQSYLEVITELTSKYDSIDEVVSLSAFGDILGVKKPIREEMYSQWHAWGYALKRSHHVERSWILQGYYSILSENPYHKRDDVKIREYLANLGIITTFTSQDSVKDAIRRHFGRLALTTGARLGNYIGKIGQHFTPQIFETLGYGDLELDSGPLSLNLGDDRRFFDAIHLQEKKRFAYKHFNWIDLPLIQLRTERDTLLTERDSVRINITYLKTALRLRARKTLRMRTKSYE